MINALYYGDSTQAQTYDWSGNGNSLTENGAVNNPSSPTPPQGDRWLGETFSLANYFSVPVGVIPTGGQGVFAFYMRMVNDQDEVTEEVANWFNAGSSRYMTVKVEQPGGPGGNFRLSSDYTNSVGANQNVNTATTLVKNQTYLVRYEWDATGFRIKVDGVTLASTAVQPGFGTVAANSIGVRPGFGRSLTHLVDAAMYADDPNQQYPATDNPLLDNRRRR